MVATLCNTKLMLYRNETLRLVKVELRLVLHNTDTIRNTKVSLRKK